MFNFDNLFVNYYYGGQNCTYSCVPYDYRDLLRPFRSNQLHTQNQQNFSLTTTIPLFQNNYPLKSEEFQCSNIPNRDSECSELHQEKVEERADVPFVTKIEQESGREAKMIKLEQKYGRNIASNIFHCIVRWTTIQPNFEPVIQAAIKCNRFRITLQQFKQKMRQKTQHLKGYVNMKVIRGIYMGRRIGATSLDLQFSKLLKIVSKVYLKNYHLNHIYYSTKINKKSRPLHYKKMRVLLKAIK